MEGTAATKLIDMDEAAAYLGLRKSTLYEWCAERKIEHKKIGRLNKFDQRYLEKWVSTHTRKVRTHGTN